MASRAAKGILSGIKVLDMTQVIAGPASSHLLAEMGAEVIKIELAPTGDRYRFFIQMKNRGTAFVRLNRGKKSLCMNLRTAQARAFKRLNPRIVMCSISGYGQDGPWAQLPGNDTCSQAMAELFSSPATPTGHRCTAGSTWPT